MRREHREHLAATIVEFSRFLRTSGFTGDLRQTMTALESARSIDAGNGPLFASALKTSLCCNREEWERFPQLFREFWGENQARPRSAAGEYKGSLNASAEERQEGPSMFLGQPANSAAAKDGSGKAVYGASPQQRLKRVDFSEVPSNDLPQLEAFALRFLRRMSVRLSRRFTLLGHAERIDLRRSIRRSIASGGELIVLSHKARRPAKSRLVILLDVSGSMNFYSMFLVRFAYALQACFQRVDTFLFSTNVVKISDLLRNRSLPDALRRLAQRAAGWSGGTKIGESLDEFNRTYGPRLLSRDTVFIVLSDGWETGDPQLLADQMRSAKRRVRKILWLNPLLGLRDYQPLTRGMVAALPYVDVFAPANNLESLLALEKYL